MKNKLSLEEAEKELEALIQYLKENHFMSMGDRAELYAQGKWLEEYIEGYKDGRT